MSYSQENRKIVCVSPGRCMHSVCFESSCMNLSGTWISIVYLKEAW